MAAPDCAASFEVSIDGTIVHSKLRTMAYPDLEQVAEIVASVADGQPVTQVTKTVSDGGCVVM